jgi:membrane protein implicated in regulation of membrane protease activity
VTNSVNWILIIAGALAIVAEVVLGVVTGFDLAIMGLALMAGGGLGLAFGSAKVGLFAAGAFAFLYLAFFRRQLKSRLAAGPVRATNIDVVLGKTGLVTERIAPHAPGIVRVGDELWRAALMDDRPGAEAKEPGATVVVDSVEGVTLKVR